MNFVEHVSPPVQSVLTHVLTAAIHIIMFFSGDASLESPLDVSEYVSDLPMYTLNVTAVNCNGQTATVYNHVPVYVSLYNINIIAFGKMDR